jgi:sugar/nucleoside kinase (ribokinase family)
MKYDFIAVGDTVVDDFIKLKDATVHCDINNENCTITMRFADKIPFESSTVVYGVGNAANAAVSAVRLGLKTAFVSNVGADENGNKIIDYFKKQKLETKYVKKNGGAKTNYHYVLSYGADRTILVKHEAYPYVFPKDLPEPKTLYLSSLASGTEDYHDAIAAYAEAHPNMFLVFQPGTFQMKIGKERLKRLYARANMLVLNKEEAQRVLSSKDDDIEKLARALQALGPKIVLVTDGPNGVYALENDSFFHVPMFPDPKPPVNRTGAGDALASTTASYLTMGMSLKDAITRGTVNSAYVVQGVGAQMGLLKKDDLESILAKNQA